ncbi:phage antirepressor KilAC domain-containing protein [Candidatus Pacearchaeota archaeon]|jgi:phage antirepressor YoqD-like protein|nr:phage antirepressor KilAC domain-containing protein [Candidatus Pacearchaeota archaeon]
MSDNHLSILEDAQNALAQSGRVIEALKGAIAAMKPNADLGAAIVSSGKVYEVREAAKELSIQIAPGKYLGPSQLYAFLRSTWMIMKRRDPRTHWDYHAPKQEHVDAGRMKLEERMSNAETEDGSMIVNRMTIITPKGLVYIREKITKAIEEGAIYGLIGG